MKHFLVFGQVVTKYISKTCCTPTPTVPVTLDADIVDHKKLNVTTTINNSFRKGTIYLLHKIHIVIMVAM